MNKRGDSQVDWAISLGIFLLYLAWFFIFIRPSLVQEQIPNLVSLVRDNFERDAFWTVERVPIIVTSERNLTKEPIIVNISSKYSESNSFMQNQAFIINNGRLFFIGDVNFSSIFYLISSNETYTMFNQITDLTATEQQTTVTDFSADFENFALKSAFFFGTKIRDSMFTIEGQAINTSNSSFSNKKIAAQYSIKTQALNLTTYIFAYNPRIYLFFSTNKNIFQRFELDRYEGYFFDNADNGNIHYPEACYEKNTTQLLFHDNSSNLLFLFDREVSFDFCSQNTSIELEINFDNSAEERIIFFRGDYLNYTSYIDSYEADVGVKEELNLPSLTGIQALSLANYNDLKNRWGVQDFRIFVTNISNEELISTIGTSPYEKATVYAEETRSFLLDKFGELEDIKISFQSWR